MGEKDMSMVQDALQALHCDACDVKYGKDGQPKILPCDDHREGVKAFGRPVQPEYELPSGCEECGSDALERVTAVSYVCGNCGHIGDMEEKA